jgi:hypothetical protein
MLPRLLILSLLIPACIAPAAAQSSQDKNPFSSSSQDGLTFPPQFHLRAPSLSQNAQVNPVQLPSPQVSFNLSPTTPHTYLGFSPNSLLPRSATLGQNTAPCYAIRSYRFSREDPQSDSTKFADYSTCQPSTQFHVKNAVTLPPR